MNWFQFTYRPPGGGMVRQCFELEREPAELQSAMRCLLNSDPRNLAASLKLSLPKGARLESLTICVSSKRKVAA